ncbi:MAG: hypothetical protein CME70_19260 [Halobacteriovorax sp.]|nr:hypothetical protein [Halobacteriovorax sp.]|tara:strand:+ start:576 stop:899 length:324 start_codon:yes stop_codon:yes gene_type:complete
MRITKRQLKRIIKEEKAKLIAEAKVRRKLRENVVNVTYSSGTAFDGVIIGDRKILSAPGFEADQIEALEAERAMGATTVNDSEFGMMSIDDKIAELEDVLSNPDMYR